MEEARLVESRAEEAAAAAEAAVRAAAAVAATAAVAAAAASTAAAAAAAASRVPTPAAALRVPIPTAAVAAVRVPTPADAAAQRAVDGYVLSGEEVRELRTASRDRRLEDSSNGGGAGGAKAKAASFAAVVPATLPRLLQRSKTLQAREMEALASMRLAEVDVRHRLVAVKRELQRSMSSSAVAVAKDNLTLTTNH